MNTKNTSSTGQRRVVAVGKAYTFMEVLAEAQRKQAEEQARFDAMTAEEKTAYIKQRQAKEAEAEAILKQLRGSPGFMEVRV